MRCEFYGIIHQGFFDETRDAAKRRANQQYPNEKDPTLLWTPKELEGQNSYELDLESNTLTITSNNCLGDFIIKLPFTIEMEIKILEHAARQVNKMKAALQSMK